MATRTTTRCRCTRDRASLKVGGLPKLATNKNNKNRAHFVVHTKSIPRIKIEKKKKRKSLVCSFFRLLSWTRRSNIVGAQFIIFIFSLTYWTVISDSAWNSRSGSNGNFKKATPHLPVDKKKTHVHTQTHARALAHRLDIKNVYFLLKQV